MRINVGDELLITPSWHYDGQGKRIGGELPGKVVYINLDHNWILLEFQTPKGIVKEAYKIIGRWNLFREAPELVRMTTGLDGVAIADCRHGGICCNGVKIDFQCKTCERWEGFNG